METMVTRRGFAKLAATATTMTALGTTRAMAAALAKPTGKVILTISGLIGNTNNGEKAEFDKSAGAVRDLCEVGKQLLKEAGKL